MNFPKGILNWFVTLCSILVFLAYVFGSLSFKHQHILSDGTVIEHSHPHPHPGSNNNQDDHGHDKDEICIKGLVTPGIVLHQSYIQFTVETQELFISTPILIEETVRLKNFPQNILRGPPSC